MNKAMTLIEVLVVIAIMLILMAVAVFVNPRPSVELDNAARQLVSDLRRAQNMAMSASTQIDGWGNEIVPCGYGIYTPNTQKYVIFYNETDCSKFQHWGGPNPPWQGSIDFETVDFTDVAPGITITQGVSLSIYFIPPSGTTYINGDYPLIPPPPLPYFELTASDGSIRTVTVTSAGKIEIQ